MIALKCASFKTKSTPSYEWQDGYAFTTTSGGIGALQGASALLTFVPVPSGHSVKVAWGGNVSPGGYFIEYDANKQFVYYWGNQGSDGRTITTNARTAYIRFTAVTEKKSESYILDVTTGEYLMHG